MYFKYEFQLLVFQLLHTTANGNGGIGFLDVAGQRVRKVKS